MAANATSFADILNTQFNASVPNEDLNLLNYIKAKHPNSQHVAVKQNGLQLSSFLQAKDVQMKIFNDAENIAHELLSWDASNERVYSNLLTGVSSFTYANTSFLIYKITWTRDRVPSTLFCFVFDGDSDAAGKELLTGIFKWMNDLKDEMWVFEHGRWGKNKEMWKAVQESKWDDLVLDQEFSDGLRRDTETFFKSKSIYKSLGIVWKRGLLLLGPPGNGKTESIKVLLKESGQAALYVKSFTNINGAEASIWNIFQHARTNAPCILVLEDLDSMVTPEVRSSFLNELDGITPNEGVLIISTTNHPERIDDAILNRPSRFDVKYDFTLPSLRLRKNYALKWLKKSEERKLDDGEDAIKFQKDKDELAGLVAEKTEGFSFAFLKELFVSFLLRLAHDRSRGGSQTSDIDDLLITQITKLSAQILNPEPEPATSANATMGPRIVRRLAQPQIIQFGEPVPVGSIDGLQAASSHAGPVF